MIRRPPRSTLFPTRRSSDLYPGAPRVHGVEHPREDRAHDPKLVRGDRGLQRMRRSEEHTSELQSLAYLVCRLLLEKKNDLLELTSSTLGNLGGYSSSHPGIR